MTEQPEALRLAERLEDSQSRDCCSQRTEAAAELRRLHAVNKQLLEALESRDSGDPECEHGFFYDECPNETCDKRSYKAAIAAAKGEA